MSERGLLIANLDAETEHAQSTCPGPIARLTPKISALVSHLGTLMRVFAEGPSRLWTPSPVDSSAVPELEFVPPIHFETGPRPGAHTEAIWWCLPTPAAQRGADRRRCLAIARTLEVSLPGTVIVTSLAELREGLDRIAARTATNELAWVLKAPLSASGRERVRRRGTDLDTATATRIQRLLAAYGGAVLEPWKQRTLDVGCTGVIGPSGQVVVATPHLIRNDDGGVFRGITTGDAAAQAMSADELGQLTRVCRAVGDSLAGDGLRGPYGIDAFVYTEPGSGVDRKFHPLCEINARHTFGHVAQRLTSWMGHAIELELGRVVPPGGKVVLRPTATLPGAWIRARAEP